MNLALFAQSKPIRVKPARQVRPDPTATDLRFKVKGLWMEEAPFFLDCEELATFVSSQTGVSVPVIRAWRSLYNWPLPTAHARSKWVSDDDDDPLIHAEDPLGEFFSERRERSYRRMLGKYLDTTGFNSPAEANLSEVQEILNRHPVSLWNLAIGLGQEPAIFCVYAKAKGIVEPQHARIDIPLGTLMFHHEGFATFIVRNAQHLYYHRAVPISSIASRLGLNWRDLWLFGVRFGYWRMPEAENLAAIDDFLTNRPVRKRQKAAIEAIKAAPGRQTKRTKTESRRAAKPAKSKESGPACAS